MMLDPDTWKSSGAAYGGDPQNVSSFPPSVNSLLKPKSAILMFMSASRRRFSACRKTGGGRGGMIFLSQLELGKKSISSVLDQFLSIFFFKSMRREGDGLVS